MSKRPEVLLEYYLKKLKLPTFKKEYEKHAEECAKRGSSYEGYLHLLAEREINEREKRLIERRIKGANFPRIRTLDGFDFKEIPTLNKPLVQRLSKNEYIDQRENVLIIGNSGTGKSHIGISLGVAACHKTYPVLFFTAAGLANQLIEAKDERNLIRFQKKLSKVKLLIVDELGYIPLSKMGAELLFDVFAQRYETGSIIVTSNLPFNEWTQVLGSERLTGALLDRLTHHVEILEMNGESYRVKQSREKNKKKKTDTA